jgi:hypothetical protein
MHSLIHEHLAKASGPDPVRGSRAFAPPPRAQPPPGRLRSHVAQWLARVAIRLDRERARRALA